MSMIIGTDRWLRHTWKFVKIYGHTISLLAYGEFLKNEAF